MQINDLIKYTPTLADFLNDIPSEIINKFVIKKFSKKTIIVSKNDDVKFVYLICTGKMRIVNEFDNGHLYAFAEIGPLSLLGDLELLADESKFACTVETITDCTTLKIGCEEFIRCLEESQHFSKIITKRLAKRLYMRSYRNGENIFYSFMYNMVYFIIQYAQEEIQKNNVVSIPMTRQQLADRLGISERTVNRTINKMKVDNLISLKKGKINIDKDQYLKLINILDGIK